MLRVHFLAALSLAACVGEATPPPPARVVTAPAAPLPPTTPADRVQGQAFFAQACELQQAGRHGEAIVLFARAVEVDPGHGLAYVHQAESQAFVDDDSQKIHQLLSRAVELMPDSPRAHLRFAEVSASLGQTEAAQEHFRRALELRPGWPEAALSFAGYLERSGPAGYEAALAELRSLLAADPGNTQARVLRAEILERTGAHADAAKEMETAAAAVARSAPLFRRAAELYELANTPKEATRLRRLADQLDPPPRAPKKRELRPARGSAKRGG